MCASRFRGQSRSVRIHTVNPLAEPKCSSSCLLLIIGIKYLFRRIDIVCWHRRFGWHRVYPLTLTQE